MKFAPEKNIDKFEVFIDLQKFMRKLRIRKHYALNKDKKAVGEPSEFKHTDLRNNSIFNPKVPGNQCMNAFKKMVESDLAKLERKKPKDRNVWKAIKEIGKRKEVVIRPADKGGGIGHIEKRRL